MTMLAAAIDVRRRSRSQPIDVRAMDGEQLADLAEQLCGAAVPGVRMTEREFVEWSFGRVDAEWSDGEVILMPPVSDEHNDLDTWLTTLVRMFVEARLGGFVRNNMFVRFPRRRRRRVPDLMYIAEAHAARVTPTLVEGAPDLIMEIVSADSRNRDRRDKYFDYEASGVREFWIIDPLMRTVDLYTLEGRKYRAVDAVEGQFRSTVLDGFYLRDAWLFGRTLPKVAAVLKEFAGARSRPAKSPRRSK